MSAKRTLELTVLDIAKELLGKLYGKFDTNPDQEDRPDAEINVYKPKKNKFGREPFNVGIEITTVDSSDHLGYFNDKKHGRDMVAERISNAIASRKNIGQSIKYMETPIPEDYISSGVMGKSKDYATYINSGNYREVALLCFSQLVNIESNLFRDGLKPWTEYKLSAAEYPYDVVIFVDLRSRRAVRVYEKRRPAQEVPPAYPFEGATIERSETFLLTNQAGEFLNSNPLITPKTASN